MPTDYIYDVSTFKRKKLKKVLFILQDSYITYAIKTLKSRIKEELHGQFFAQTPLLVNYY